MTRCIFRKRKKRLRASHWFGVVTVMLGAALCLELQAELKPVHDMEQRSTWLGGLHDP